MSTNSSLCVALVDDDESLCRSLGRLLRASGMQPVAYGSAEGFLADTTKPRFDCLLLDVQLGGMSGIDLARQLVEQGGCAPFIFITARDDRETRAAAQAVGCVAYFLKSDNGADVLAAVRRAIRIAR